jgi:hypothetical protein
MKSSLRNLGCRVGFRYTRNVNLHQKGSSTRIYQRSRMPQTSLQENGYYFTLRLITRTLALNGAIFQLLQLKANLWQLRLLSGLRTDFPIATQPLHARGAAHLPPCRSAAVAGLVVRLPREVERLQEKTSLITLAAVTREQPHRIISQAAYGRSCVLAQSQSISFACTSDAIYGETNLRSTTRLRTPMG